MGHRIEFIKRIKREKGLGYLFSILTFGWILAIFVLIGWVLRELGIEIHRFGEWLIKTANKI